MVETPELLLDNIKTCLDQKKHRKADETYKDLKKKFPDDYRVYEAFLLLVLAGKDFSTHKFWDHAAGYEQLVCGRGVGSRIDDFMHALSRLKSAAPKVYDSYCKALLDAVNKVSSEESGRAINGGMTYFKVRTYCLLIN